MLQRQTRGDLNRVALLHLFGFPNLLSCLLDQSLTKFVSLPLVRRNTNWSGGLKIWWLVVVGIASKGWLIVRRLNSKAKNFRRRAEDHEDEDVNGNGNENLVIKPLPNKT